MAVNEPGPKSSALNCPIYRKCNSVNNRGTRIASGTAPNFALNNCENQIEKKLNCIRTNSGKQRIDRISQMGKTKSLTSKLLQKCNISNLSPAPRPPTGGGFVNGLKFLARGSILFHLLMLVCPSTAGLPLFPKFSSLTFLDFPNPHGFLFLNLPPLENNSDCKQFIRVRHRK